MNDSDFIWQNDVSSLESSLVGTLAKDMARLKNHDIEVQNFFVLNSRKFSNVVSRFSSEISQLISNMNLSNVDSITSASKQIQTLIDSYEFNDDFKTRLLNFYRELEEADSKYSILSDRARELIKSGRELPTVTLRLSLNVHICSYEAKVNLRGLSQILTGIKSLWKDIFSVKSLYLMKKKGIDISDLNPAIIFQKTLLPSKSGDFFTVNPLNSNNYQVYLQAQWGLNNDYMDNVSWFIVEKENYSILSSKLNKQEEFATKKSLTSELIVQHIPENYQLSSPLSEQELVYLSKIAEKIESVLDFPQHVNWIVFDKKLIIVKTEPITNIFKKPVNASAEASDYIVKATAINNGEASGVYYKNFVYDSKAIFKINQARSSFIPYLILSSGIISKSNSLSSYLSISCQELDIPCLLNVPDVSSLQEGQKIKIRGPYIFLDRDAYSQGFYSTGSVSSGFEPEPQPSSYRPEQFDSSSTAEEEPNYTSSSNYDSSNYSPPANSGLSSSYESSNSSSDEDSDEMSFSTPESTDYETSFSDEDSDLNSVSDVMNSVVELESKVNELVLKSAEARRTSELSDSDEKQARILSEAEWIIRDLKKKLSELN